MKRIVLFTLMAFILSAGFSACSPKADFDIRGSWDYIMMEADGNQYDIGTITFDGSPSGGEYSQLNIYEVEYSGEYKVSGPDVTLTGYENWQGTFNNEDNISGTWQHDDGAKGTFEANRK